MTRLAGRRAFRFLVALAALVPATALAQAGRAQAPPVTEVPANPQSALLAQRDRLAIAIVKRDAAAVRAAIASGMDLDFNFSDLNRGRTDESPLNLAIFRGHLEIALLLLEGGADANRPDAAGRRPVHQARSAESVRLLVRFGADPNARDSRRRAATTHALERGDLQAFDMLLENGARIDAGAGGEDLLALVIERKHPQLVGPLLDRGVDPRSPPTRALWLLIEAGDGERARLVVRRGADVDARSGREWLLTRALFRQRWDIAELLLEAGASVRLPDAPACGGGHFDCESIQLARLASFNPATLAKLRARGLDLDASGRDGHTALTSLVAEQPLAVRAARGPTSASVAQNAVTGGTVATTVEAPAPKGEIPAPDNVARSKALLDLGVDPNRKYRDFTPLMLAIALPGKPKALADTLLDFGGRIEYAETISGKESGGKAREMLRDDNDLLTGMSIGPLTWAVLNGRPDIALRLLAREGKVGKADRDLVFFAASTGAWDVLVGALPHTREVDAADRAGVTPLMLAAHAGRADAVRALLAAGAKVNLRSAAHWPPLWKTDPRAALSGHPSRLPLVGGYTALRAARERGHDEAARLLVEAGGRE